MTGGREALSRSGKPVVKPEQPSFSGAGRPRSGPTAAPGTQKARMDRP